MIVALISQSVDIDKLKKDATLIEYKKITNEIKQGLISKRYKMNSNFALAMQQLGKNPSPEQMKVKLKDAGMTNSDDFVDKLFRQTSLMTKFLKSHPEIGKLDNTARMEIIKQLLQ